MRAAAAAAAIAVAACGGPRPRPPAEAPAASWATPLPPYRLPHRPEVMWVDDRRAVVAIRAGWLAEVDLATGAVRSRRTDGVLGDPGPIAQLADGRLIHLVTREVDGGARLRFYTIDAELGLVLDREEPGRQWMRPSLAVAGTGAGARIALAGLLEPIQLYSPDAARAERSLAAHGPTGWSHLAVTGDGSIVVGRWGGDLVAIDLATDAKTTLATGMTLFGAARTGTRVLAGVGGRLIVLDARAPEAPPAQLAAEVPDVAAISADGTRVARIADDAIVVHDTTTRLVVARFALDPLDESTTAHLAFAPSGKALVVVLGAIVRVIDLEAGTISDAGPGPYTNPAFLAVTRDAIVAGADAVRRWPLAGGAGVVIGPDEPAVTDGALAPSGELVVTARPLLDAPLDDAAGPELEVTVWRVGPAAELARWTRGDSISTMAIDDDGAVVLGAWRSRDGASKRNVIDAGAPRGRWRRLLAVHYDGYVDAIDSRGLAAVSRQGAVRVIELPGAGVVSAATIPTCAGSGLVDLDARGRRLATTDGTRSFVFDVATPVGRRIAAAAFPATVGHGVFVPGTTELVLDLDDRLAVWDYAADRAVATPVGGIVGKLALDPGATRVATVLTNGRLVVFPLAALRRGDPVAIAPGGPEPSCEADPLAPPQADRESD
jgi:hypothetical protein